MWWDPARSIFELAAPSVNEKYDQKDFAKQMRLGS